MKNKFKLSLLPLVLLLGACASKPVLLDRDAIKSQPITKVYVTTMNDTISITPSASGTSGGAAVGGLIGGLVGAAIDAGVNKKRQNDLAPLLESTGNFDANDFVKTQIKTVSDSGVLSQELELVEHTKFKAVKALNSPTLAPSVVMSPNLGVLDIAIRNTMYQGELKNRPYTKVYSTQKLAESDDLEVSKESNAAYWTESPEKLLTAIKEGLSEVVQQWVDDLSGSSEVLSEETPTADAN